jgi:hypothetical protein
MNKMNAGNNLIDRVENTAKNAQLFAWQFAVDGKWDESNLILCTQTLEQRVEQLQHWFHKQVSADLAFELLFELENGERFFFGVRISHLETKEKLKVMNQILTNCQNRAPLSEAVCEVRKALSDENIANTDPEYLELGVFDLWNRVGSLVVWKKGVKLGQKTAIIPPNEISANTKSPDMGFSALHEPQTKPLMLEAAWKRNIENNQNFQCWLSLPVAAMNKNLNRFILSEERYLSAITTFMNENFH